MPTILLIAAISAAIVTIASGVWVATALWAAISSPKRSGPLPSPDVATVDREP